MTQCSQQGCVRSAHDDLVLRFNGQWFAFCQDHYHRLSTTLNDYLRDLRRALGR